MGKPEKCSECNKVVTMSIGNGLSCPNCGARWTSENGKLVLVKKSKKQLANAQKIFASPFKDERKKSNRK